MTYLMIGAFAVLLMIDLPAVLREKNRVQLVIFIVLCCFAFSYLLAYMLDAEVPSLKAVLTKFFADTLGLSYERWQGHP